MDKQDFLDKLRHGDLWLGKQLERCETKEELSALMELHNLQEWIDDEVNVCPECGVQLPDAQDGELCVQCANKDNWHDEHIGKTNG